MPPCRRPVLRIQWPYLLRTAAGPTTTLATTALATTFTATAFTAALAAAALAAALATAALAAALAADPATTEEPSFSAARPADLRRLHME